MQFVIFHGSYGNPHVNWFDDLKENLEKLGQDVLVPTFPVEKWVDVEQKGEGYNSPIQNLTSWMEVFDKDVYPLVKDRNDVCFVSHSISPIFNLHIVDKYNLQLDSAIFASPFLETLPMWQFNAVNGTFYKSDFDFEKLQKLIPVSYTLFGDNDPYVPIEKPITFAEKMNSSKIIIKGGQHLNDDIQLTKFPLVVDLCRTRIG